MGDAGDARRRRRHGLGRPGPRVGGRARRSPRRGRPLDPAPLGHELPRHRHRPRARRQRASAPPGRRPAQRVAARRVGRRARARGDAGGRARELEQRGQAPVVRERRRESSPPRATTSTRSCCSPAQSSSGKQARRGDEKGHGICHGTSGNGFALLAAFERTQDELWLDRARRFAVHALAQAERMPGPLLALHRRRRNRALRRRLSRGRRALPGARAQPSSPLKRITYDRARWTNASSATRSSSSGSAPTSSPVRRSFCSPRSSMHELARALARQAYKAGASYVHVRYQDSHVLKAMIELGPDEALTYSPEWLKTFFRSMSGNAMLATTGDPEPELLADLDGERVGRAVPHEVVQIRMQQISENNVNWCGVGAPSEGWAKQVFGEPDVEQLWEKVAFCMRLDEPDPVAAWRDHTARLKARAAALNDLRPDALRYRGPGTDLTVGLLPGVRWLGGGSDTSTGIPYVANMPTEEVFTSPDAGRTEGTIRSIAAAFAPGPDRARPRADVRERAGRKGRGRDRRGARPEPLRDDRERRPAGRGRARHEGVARRPDRDALLRHALRRERDLPHRVRRRFPLPRGRRSRPTA